MGQEIVEYTTTSVAICRGHYVFARPDVGYTLAIRTASTWIGFFIPSTQTKSYLVTLDVHSNRDLDGRHPEQDARTGNQTSRLQCARFRVHVFMLVRKTKQSKDVVATMIMSQRQSKFYTVVESRHRELSLRLSQVQTPYRRILTAIDIAMTCARQQHRQTSCQVSTA